MLPAQLAAAADLLEPDAAPAGSTRQNLPEAAALLTFLGLFDSAGKAMLPAQEQRQFARLLRFAARLDAVFPMRVPTAPAAAFFGARRTHAADSELAGSERPAQADYAGLAGRLAQAFSACVGEAAEHDAMLERRSDSRMDEDGSLPLLDSGLRPAGGVDAALILRGAGDGSMPPPRSSTGYAAGRNLGEAAFFALLECIERHAVSLWFNRLRRPSPLTPDSETARNIAFLRRGAGSRCRLLRLGHEFSGAAAAAAFSVNAEGAAAVGYGCAPSAQLAALKAVRELCQGEFALHLEAQSAHAETLPFTRRSKLFAQNADLFETIQEEPAEEPGASGLADLCAAIRQPVRFVNLTLSENAIPVVCALAGGLRDICGETGPQEVGPL